MIKVLAIMGSPRKKMNNDTLLDNFLLGLKEKSEEVEIERINAADLNIAGCTACDACSHKLGCVIKDDMKGLIEKFNDANMIIVTSPLYFNSITAQLKALIDRNQVIWSSKYALKNSLIDRNKVRFGFVLITGGAKEQPYGLSAVEPIFDLFFRSVNTEYKGNFFISNVDEKPVYEDKEVQHKARAFGESLVVDYLKETIQ
ncbi:flavodoxin family protein [Alkaliphilus serpentinus]|uniref:Flavodoxin family protein n=1 Tax=Alkaliphilus serpentinus TaxID=1482731 RepID=A0A833HQA6_9FIRM|nr:flavodoxin family protein [Alkaliphilus serpentinus]KAB3531510.1 flavodoxin family protein [Alkaliphilus serpentinus]